MVKKLSLGEAAIEFGVSIADLLKRMKEDTKYSIEDGRFVFIIGEPELREAKKEDMQRIWRRLKNELTAYPTHEQWDNLIKDYGSGINGIIIPTSEEIREICGCSWTQFLKSMESRKVENEYQKIKAAFLDIDRERSTPNEIRKHKNHKERIHDLIVRDIAKRTRLEKKYISKFLIENGLLDGGYILENLGSIDKIIKTHICGIRIYNGDAKKREREIICDKIKINMKNPRDLRYLGLPGVNFIDYHLFYQRFGIVTNQSLAVERARKEANVMRSILSHWDIVEGGDIFDGLNFYEGCVDEAVNRRLDKITKDGFNLIFLDYQGSWGKDKEQAVRNLFKYQNLADGAILLLTLNKSPIELSRFERGRGCGQDGYHTKDQEVTCLGYIEDLCKEGGYHCDIILEDQYKDTVDMETLGFCISKVKPVVVVPKSLPMGD